mmetsp:Transcript_55024/g.128715  ORF Transcript_55024/g.128715 Transcript_55024/m.128715 type:complete len:228 (+) Transcript_55024:427-1110(+)
MEPRRVDTFGSTPGVCSALFRWLATVALIRRIDETFSQQPEVLLQQSMPYLVHRARGRCRCLSAEDRHWVVQTRRSLATKDCALGKCSANWIQILECRVMVCTGITWTSGCTRWHGTRERRRTSASCGMPCRCCSMCIQASSRAAACTGSSTSTCGPSEDMSTTWLPAATQRPPGWCLTCSDRRQRRWATERVRARSSRCLLRLPLSGPPTSTLSEARSRATRWATG